MNWLHRVSGRKPCERCRRWAKFVLSRRCGPARSHPNSARRVVRHEALCAVPRVATEAATRIRVRRAVAVRARPKSRASVRQSAARELSRADAAVRIPGAEQIPGESELARIAGAADASCAARSRRSDRIRQTNVRPSGRGNAISQAPIRRSHNRPRFPQRRSRLTAVRSPRCAANKSTRCSSPPRKQNRSKQSPR